MNKYDQRMKQLTNFPGGGAPEFPTHLSEAELDNVERELGHTLPDEYREFLRDYGGHQVASGVEIPNSGEPSYGGCEYFLGVTPTIRCADIVARYRSRGARWPSELLFIADGDNGSVCLVIAGAQKGAVSFWHTEGDGGDPISEHLHFVANSFDEFINLLDPRPVSEEQD